MSDTGARTWSDLAPDAAVLAALDSAGTRGVDGRNEKKRWSESFADRSAVAVAAAFRAHPFLRATQIKPDRDGSGLETFQPLGEGNGKRIDVTVHRGLAGLQIGCSLKGLGFKDGRSNNYDKNLTGRLYELRDEVTTVHSHLPQAVMVGIFCLPFESVEDKTERAASSFARTVLALRGRTGRSDPMDMVHTDKCDLGFVCLYATGPPEDDLRRGAARWFDVRDDPPRRGAPKVTSTLSMEQVVDRVVRHALRGSEATATWAAPE